MDHAELLANRADVDLPTGEEGAGFFTKLAVFMAIAAVATTVGGGAMLGWGAAAAVVWFLKGGNHLTDPRDAAVWKLMLHSAIPGIPTLDSALEQLEEQYHSADLLQAMESVILTCDWVEPGKGEPLAGKGRIFAYIHPETRDVYAPLDAVLLKLDDWGIQPSSRPETPGLFQRVKQFINPDGSIDVQATTVSDRPVTPAESDPVLALWEGHQPNPQILQMPMRERAQYLIERLKADGFHIDRVMAGSVIVVAGSQRGGKGTLLALLCILEQAISQGETAIRYYTAGNDIYPFKTLKTVCSDSFMVPEKDEANSLVAAALTVELKAFQQCEGYEKRGEMLVIDEAIALAHLTDPETNRNQASYLLRQFAKSGATCVIVLHANNLTAWVGAGNTAGLAQTFKDGVTLIGCKSKAMQAAGSLRSTNVATGEYFFADPENFGSPLKNSEPIGKVPDWLLKVNHPGNGAPDPARSLLAFFPELVGDTVTPMPVKYPQATEPTDTKDAEIDPWDEPNVETFKEEEATVKLDYNLVLDFIEEQIPNVGDSTTARTIYRTAGASKLGITSENASDLIQGVAMERPRNFEYVSSANNAGDVSYKLTRTQAD